MNEVKKCVDTILVTGDGDAGVCQAVISQYGCDLIYEALSCFVRKFNVGEARTQVGGDIIGALTSAGSDMSRSMQARYGDSTLYKSLFIDKKLVNSACVYAFTGTWNLDLDAVFDQSINEIPTDSYALMAPCTRRFVSFNPATRPDGLTTWVYNFGIGFAAGANSDVELHLQCSGGFKCREVDGFARGKCDCDTPRDIVIQPDRMPSQVKKGTILNENLLFTMQGAPGDGQIRYDKAYLKYRYAEGGKTIEKKTEPCTVSLVGGDGSVPGFCRFDMASFSFRCSLGEQDSGIRIMSHEVIYPHQIPG